LLQPLPSARGTLWFLDPRNKDFAPVQIYKNELESRASLQAFSALKSPLANSLFEIAIVIKQKHMLMALKVAAEIFGENSLLGFSEAKTFFGGLVIAGLNRRVTGDTGQIKTLIRSALP
jgi:hypothetical protein